MSQQAPVLSLEVGTYQIGINSFLFAREKTDISSRFRRRAH
jgi:hypothetical protein